MFHLSCRVLSFPVVRMPCLQSPGPVELLRQQHPREAVRQRQVRQRPDEVRASSARVIDAIRSAYDKCEVQPAILPFSQFSGECFTAELFATLIEQDHSVLRAQFGENVFDLGISGALARARSARRRNRVDPKFPVRRKPAAVDAACFIDPGRLPATDSDQPNVHVLRVFQRQISRRAQ